MDWAKYYQKEQTIENFIGNLYSHRRFIKYILSYDPKKVLEIGGGGASMSIFLSYLGLDVTAIDNNQKLIKNQKQIIKKYNSSAKIIYADAFKLPFNDNSFDLVYHQGLLEHFSDKDIHKLIDEQLRVAKIVVFSVPNNFYPTKDFGNERLMTKKKWEKILENYNVVISGNYSRKIFPKFYLPFAHIQYMAAIEHKTSNFS